MTLVLDHWELARMRLVAYVLLALTALKSSYTLLVMNAILKAYAAACQNKKKKKKKYCV